MMTKKAILRWSLAALSCVLLSVGFASCKDNDDTYSKPSYTITKDGKNDKTFSLGKEGGQLTLHIETNRRWEVSSTADWVSINPTSGDAGILDIAVRVLPNSSSSRSVVSPRSIPSSKPLVITLTLEEMTSKRRLLQSSSRNMTKARK